MALFGRKKVSSPAPPDGPAIDPEWARNKNGKFHRLIMFDPVVAGLRGMGGVYVIWHSGVKPSWVYVGATNDLADSIEKALDNQEIMDYEKNGGLFVTWSPVKEKFRPGVLRYLYENMNTEVENPSADDIKADPIKVLEPRRRDEGGSTNK